MFKLFLNQWKWKHKSFHTTRNNIEKAKSLLKLSEYVARPKFKAFFQF